MGDVTYIDPARQQMTSTEDNLSDVIHCLLISLVNEVILLPNAAVAEVIGYIQPEPIDGSPDWFLGRITWRERRVPLISFEIASGSGEAKEDVQQGSRIAILNTLNGNSESPYIGIVSQSIPRLSVVKSDDVLTEEKKSTDRQSISEVVSLDGQQLIIPDIDDLESRIKNIHT